MNAVLKDGVLVLNSGWVPINVTTVLDSIVAVFNERARFIDPDTYADYDFFGWVETWQDASMMSRIEASKVVPCPSYSIVKPEVIRCVDYVGNGFTARGHGRPKFSRRNVFLRDRNVCQYCNRHFKDSRMLNIDHVVPRAKGGASTWTNIVLSCVACNNKKRDRTPEEAGMHLLRKPGIPTPEVCRLPFRDKLLHKMGSVRPASWDVFLGKMVSDTYWNIELQK